MEIRDVEIEILNMALNRGYDCSEGRLIISKGSTYIDNGDSESIKRLEDISFDVFKNIIKKESLKILKSREQENKRLEEETKRKEEHSKIIGYIRRLGLDIKGEE